MKGWIVSIGLLVSCVVFAAACSVPASAPAPDQPTIASEAIASIITRFQEEIPKRMQQENIPGLAIAVVDDQTILWEQSFGYTDWDRTTPITPATLFSLQSMSKSFTATAAMFAAQEGLVDLDAPITTYLPDFHVNSIFEDHPEQKITLRTLLSHTAGFAHETTYGGNFDPAPYDFERRIASIADTWLMFPVGTRYSYSNVGIDLAGYILQVRSGMPFGQYVQKKVLDPLEMTDSTLDIQRLRANPNRAIGHTGAPLRPPVDFLLLPSGGVWSSASDMAHYLQFHINQGTWNGTRLLRADLAETMLTPPNRPANFYAQGVVVTGRHGARQVEHGGGGFGFIDDMSWYPELKLGVVVLTNASQTVDFAFRLCQDVADSIILDNPALYKQRAAQAVQIEPAYRPSSQTSPLSDGQLRALVESKALPDDPTAQQRRKAAAGTYIVTSWGFPLETVEIQEAHSSLVYTYQGKRRSLTEVSPGLFFSPGGHVLDVRGKAPTLMNIRLIKTHPSALPFQIAFNAACGLVFLSALFIWPARAIRRRITRQNAPAGQATVVQPKPWLGWIGILAGLGALFGLACLAFIAMMPDLISVPWPRPYVDLLWWQAALVSLPFAGLLTALGLVLLVALSLRRSAGKPALLWYFLAVGLLLIAFNGMVLF